MPQVSYWSRSFPGRAECLAEVRQFTQMVLGDVPGSDLVVLAVSELAGNAIVHTASGEPGGQFVVHLAAFADRWQVRVDDEGSPTDPRIVVADTGEGGETDWGAEAGRGLAMVNAVSRKWGVLGDHYARAVWAEIPYPEQNGTAVRSVMSGNMLDALEAAADALAAEDDEDQDYGGLADGDTPGPEGEREAAADTPAEPAPAEPAEPAEPVEPAEPPAPRVPAPQWPGRVPYDPKLAERHRRAARSAVFMRALLDHAYLETIGPRPLPYWPPFPNPLMLRRDDGGNDHGHENESESQEVG
ncbi:MAG: ATP-binding protein [Catenulisporales bacterium]|nr:ATP-binding protein [Catenulisporales bacterium]